MTVNNDETQGMASGVVIVAAIRSGGTFLAHCLSNHPAVFCDRGEPLHHGSVWCTVLQPNRRQLLAVLVNQTGYAVSTCKLTYHQAFHPEIWPWLEKRRPKVVWLRRENTIRQAVSVIINKQARNGRVKRPQHTLKATADLHLALEPALVLRSARGLLAHDQRARQRLAPFETLPITYEQIVGPGNALNTDATRAICRFLEVPYRKLSCDLVRVNPQPLADMLTNWREVEAAIRGSEFAGCLEDEC